MRLLDRLAIAALIIAGVMYGIAFILIHIAFALFALLSWPLRLLSQDFYALLGFIALYTSLRAQRDALVATLTLVIFVSTLELSVRRALLPAWVVGSEACHVH